MVSLLVHSRNKHNTESHTSTNGGTANAVCSFDNVGPMLGILRNTTTLGFMVNATSMIVLQKLSLFRVDTKVKNVGCGSKSIRGD
jgi:hypothetical protein